MTNHIGEKTLIVQCEHCQTKYRIADEKVRGKAVKVRCAKCDNVFTITPQEADIQTLSQGLGPSEPGMPEQGPSFPSPEAESFQDHAGGEGEDSSGLASQPLQDGLEDQPELGKEAPSADADIPEQPPDSFLPPSPDEGSVDFGSPRPAHEMDQAILGSSTPPDTFEQHNGREDRAEGPIEEEAPPGSNLFGADADISPSVPGQESDEGWGNIALDGQPAADSHEGDFGLADSSGYESAPSVSIEEPMEQDFSDVMGEPEPATSSIPTYQPETRTSSGGKKGLLILMLLAVLGGGGYFAYPEVMDLIQSRRQQPAGALTPANVQVKALTRTDGKIIYSVRGEVRNESAGNIGMIQVEAQFRNASGDVLSKSTSFCGNVFEDSELTSLDLGRIQTDLQNELGQSLSNANIAPGQTVPFLVILDKPPAGIHQVTVTISSFKETT